ncbi:MAG: zinc ribbon domain-containing protein [Phycisphaerales bacterium]|nr:zinc ribbon domain-containing protein [Phycisphaerales bacterium]
MTSDSSSPPVPPVASATDDAHEAIRHADRPKLAARSAVAAPSGTIAPAAPKKRLDLRSLLIMVMVALGLVEIVYFLWFYKSFEPRFPNSVDFGVLGYLRASSPGRGSSLSWIGVVALGRASSYRLDVLALVGNIVFTAAALGFGGVAILRLWRNARPSSRCINCGYRYVERHRLSVACPECGSLPRLKKPPLPFWD